MTDRARGLKARFDTTHQNLFALMQGAVFSGLCPARRQLSLLGVLPRQTAPHSSRALPARKAPNLNGGAPQPMASPQSESTPCREIKSLHGVLSVLRLPSRKQNQASERDTLFCKSHSRGDPQYSHSPLAP